MSITTCSMKPVPLSMSGIVSSFFLAFALAYSIYILLRGHNAPGGGFIGGLLAGGDHQARAQQHR